MLRFFHIGFALALSLTALAVRPCLCCEMRAEVEQAESAACHACPEETPAPVESKGHDCNSGSGCCSLSARHDAVSPPNHALPHTLTLEKVPAIAAIADAPVQSASVPAGLTPTPASRTTLQLICVYRC